MFSALRSSAFRRHSALFRTCRGPISGRWIHQDGSTLKSGFKARRDSWLNPTIFVLGFIPIFTFALGTWQLQRLQWKINLIDELKEKLEREPITLPRLVNLSVIPDFIFRKVLLKGRWDHEHTMLIGPRVREGSHGYHVVTPLMRPDGSTVLVDRGFISKDKVDKAGHLLENEEVQILGMLRTAQARNSFTPNNLPDEGIWYWTDVDAMAEYAGGEAARVQPVFIEQIFDGYAGEAEKLLSQGMPIGREATVDVRNAHLSYVLTWYSLSALTTIMLARLILRRRRMAVVRPMPR